MHSPDNYRGITILSCLNIFLKKSGLLYEEQAGFRKHYGTTDHIFTLKLLTDFYLFKNKRSFCAFIDYRKASDSV